MENLNATAPSAANDRLSKRNLWGYSLGGIGRDMAYSLTNTYLLTFILFTKSVSTAQFAAISVIIICCRIFDGLNDPLMGSIIELTRTKIGKFKPWIIIGAITNVAVIMSLFLVPLTGQSYVIFFAFGYLLWGITFTMNDISYWGMLPSLTSNEGDRNTLSTIANLAAGIGGGIAMVAIPIFTVGNFAIGGNAVSGYGAISAIVCVFFILSQTMTCLTVKEKPLPDIKPLAEGEKKRGIMEMFSVIFKNDQLKAIASVLLFFNIGSAIMTGLCSYFIYFRFGYQGMLVTIFTVLSGISAGIMIIYPLLSKKFTRRQIAKISWITIAVGYIGLLIVGLSWHGTASFYVLALCGASASIGQSVFYMVETISIANTVEYNQYKTGRRDEGIIFSVRPFMAKLGSALQQGIISLVLIALSISATTQAISEQENLANIGSITAEQKTFAIEQLIAGVAPSVTQWLIACMSVLPLLILSIAFVIYFKKYKITEQYYDQILADINAKAAEGETAILAEGEITILAEGETAKESVDASGAPLAAADSLDAADTKAD